MLLHRQRGPLAKLARVALPDWLNLRSQKLIHLFGSTSDVSRWVQDQIKIDSFECFFVLQKIQKVIGRALLLHAECRRLGMPADNFVGFLAVGASADSRHQEV